MKGRATCSGAKELWDREISKGNLRCRSRNPHCMEPPACTRSASGQSGATSNTAASRFLGRWDLTLKGPDRDWPSWIEISEDGGQLKARMTGRWGNVRPLPKVDISDGKLTFVSPKEEEDSKTDMVFEGKLTGKTLTGTVNGPDGSTWQWVGDRAPALVYTRTPHWGKPVSLFNGKDLTGWHPDKPGAPEWTVENGTIVKSRPRPRAHQRPQVPGLQAPSRIQLRQGCEQRRLSARSLRSADRN